jgi:hypothetical protein
MGPLVLPLIAAGASLAGSAINAGSQSRTNQSQLSYSREMYDKQRADALADWNRQNQYNSPKEQMMRFKEAGLNPNLIYGQMTQSPVVRSSSVEGYSPRAPQVDLGNAAAMGLQGLSTYQDTQLKNVQTDLVKEQIKNASTDNMLKQLDWAEKNIKLPYAQQMAESNAQALKIQNDQRLVDLEFSKQNNPIRLETNQYQLNNLIKDLDVKIQSMNLSKAQEAQAYQTIASLKKSGILQELDINLKKQGVQPGDNVLLRILTQGITQGQGINWFKEKANNLAKWLKENLYE